MKKLSFFNRIAFYLNLVSSLALLLACIVPYTNSASLAFFSLAVPGLVLINLFFVLYWLLRKRALVVIPIAVYLYWYITLGSFITFNISPKPIGEHTSLNIMTYNTLGFRGKEDDWESTAGDSIVAFINTEKPDIVCFQEYDYMKMDKDSFKGYPYSSVDSEFGKNDTRLYQAIYSKHRIIDVGYLEFGNTYNSSVYADVLVKSDTLRLYSVHLQSLNIRPWNLKSERSDRLFARLRRSFEKQQQQTEIIRKHMDSSPYTNIVVGDFNNNQYSSVYFNLKRDLKDTFIEKGNGYGATINFWKFPFRIDFILVDPSLEVLSHQNYTINLSDHEPIMASIKIPRNK
ncbi:endonuclease/exonuclease/phosphatase family protein [Maribacter chungangensis]|uniref:Endonuclease/exonuclease/phosphatase family protein n=1 Tax=Maribacter chungangensis TaxID=1069117 RepID=A0ABW3B6M6_9FLAO